MALTQSSEALRRPQKVLWVAFPLIAVVSLILGYVGLHQFIGHDPDFGHRPIDLFYNDLQFFVLGSDAVQSKTGPYPLGMEIARFTLPGVTVYAVIEAVRLLLAVEVSRIRARRSKGHAIVCGDTPLADTLTRRLQADGVNVVEIRTEPDEFVSAGEPLRIIGDARDPQVLRDAGLDHAATLYACAAESATNIAIAFAVTRTASDNGEPLFVYSLVTDSDFCATVQAFFLGRRRPGRVRLDFFNIDHIAARRLFVDDQPAPASGRAPRILVAGTDGFALAIVVEAARRWRTAGTEGQSLSLTLVGADATELIGGLSRRYPFLSTTCTLRALDTNLMPLMRRGELSEPPDRILITYPDEEYALKTAMTAERYWRGRAGPITVRLDGAMIGGGTASGRLDGATGTVHVFGAVSAAGDPDLIRDDLTERLARVLHDRYLMGRRRRGDAPSGPERAMVSWDELPVHLRRANRSQAEDIGRKLAQIGYVITPRYAEQRDADPQEAMLAEAEIDRLAMMEHHRWCSEQRSAGWSYAPHLDEERKLHPGLLRWEELPERMRLRNYDPVRELPAILGEAGFQIVRS